jgi:hypothetical protein
VNKFFDHQAGDAAEAESFEGCVEAFVVLCESVDEATTLQDDGCKSPIFIVYSGCGNIAILQTRTGYGKPDVFYTKEIYSGDPENIFRLHASIGFSRAAQIVMTELTNRNTSQGRSMETAFSCTTMLPPLRSMFCAP